MTLSPLETPVEGLLATGTARLPYQHNILLRSFVLLRPQSNLIIYNSPGIAGSAAAIRELGGAERLLINHAHEAVYGPPGIDVPGYVHRDDREEAGASLDIAGVFEQRGMLAPDLEIIPTPGHTAGTTSFLWDNGSLRFLFTGDFIWLEHGEWKAVVLDPQLRPAYLDSLALVRELDFDVLVPCGSTDDGASYGMAGSPRGIRERVDAIMRRVESGGSR